MKYTILVAIGKKIVALEVRTITYDKKKHSRGVWGVLRIIIVWVFLVLTRVKMYNVDVSIAYTRGVYAVKCMNYILHDVSFSDVHKTRISLELIKLFVFFFFDVRIKTS